MNVLLTTEGTYPFSGGGVSTWCDTLIRNTPEVRYTLLPLMMNPHVELQYAPPPNVRRVLEVPMWGIEEPAEFISDIPFASLYERKQRTPVAAIESEFLPAFHAFLDAVLDCDGLSALGSRLSESTGQEMPRAESREPRASDALGMSLLRMEDYFRERDYGTTMKSRLVWDAFAARLEAYGRELAQTHPAGERCIPSLFDLTECLRWLWHFLVVLNVRAPRVAVTHTTAAAFCGIPCITAKLRHGTPMVLTEHGVYLREQNLFLSRFRRLFFAKHFLLSLITAVSRANYRFADVVAPVCHYNTRWEVAHGAPREKIEVIYNGVDPDRFTPGPRPDGPPHVVATARIDRLKDTETFLRVAARVRETHPSVRFTIFGAVTDEKYYAECVALRRQLGVDVAMGTATDDVVDAYRRADIVLLTSISEAFPFSVIEAMACGRAVVASDVGGVREALDGCGIVVRPRDVEQFAAALRRLLDDGPLRAKFAARARAKVIEQFRVDNSVAAYLDLYRRLA
ncbi:MAG TPA: GT4 family glycosyltransferase PelF [Thermoanaerobaculia bacterium]|nr:GT4 family glycosyltransferase PelF [Thermoanaerobaculia bacterium]